MTSLYYDCFAGISGDMNLGALLDLGVEAAVLRKGLDRLAVEGFELRIAPDRRGGIAGTRVEVVVTADTASPTRSPAAVRDLIGRSGLGRRVEAFSLRVFERLAAAEAKVHSIPIEAVYFHEVGAIDALVDVVGAAIGLEQLGWPSVIGSVVELGSGCVDCAHGRLPVPAPATLELLQGVPTRRGGVPFEATTPTGAAILTTAAERFEAQGDMVPQRVGYGIGRRDGPLPNVLRLVVTAPDPGRREELRLLECNIDDMSPEFYPHLLDRLLTGGAKDAWIAPLVMKKGRPGILVSVLCEGCYEPTLTRLLFAETTTLGVRRGAVSRTALERTVRSLATPFGPVPVKVAVRPDGSRQTKPEYEVCRSIALERDLPLREVYRELERLLEENDGT
ncbi:nickel pincer cofactor biosynthesis protein LarC [Candidatus Thiosymbion oneisti]|uniref:nickel pincer cofactor biosynthesis protein LarC n=1 Tax=Candidatus Thiosymbion oneisti TaxID=589554 RepID=UPI000B0A3909|nr:nickel pincer cofactor biosynthesis protein LarC [Candidatus Thiosymbion oneisti]